MPGNPNVPHSTGVEGGEAPSAVVGGFPMGVYRSAPTALADGDAGPILLDSAGAVVISGATPVGSTLQTLIEFDAIGNNLIIAAPGAGNYLAIRHLNFLVQSATEIRLYSSDAAFAVFTPLSGPYPFGSNGGMALDLYDGPLVCLENNGFTIYSNTNAVSVAGFVIYTVETA